MVAEGPGRDAWAAWPWPTDVLDFLESRVDEYFAGTYQKPFQAECSLHVQVPPEQGWHYICVEFREHNLPELTPHEHRDDYHKTPHVTLGYVREGELAIVQDRIWEIFAPVVGRVEGTLHRYSRQHGSTSVRIGGVVEGAFERCKGDASLQQSLIGHGPFGKTAICCASL